MAVTGSLGTVLERAFDSRYRSYRFTWTSDGSAGSVTENPLVVAPGRLVSLKCIPSGGSTAPTDLYDLTLLDADGYDLLGGVGANLGTASGSLLQWNPPVVFHGGPLTPTIANAGNSKIGTLELTIVQDA